MEQWLLTHLLRSPSFFPQTSISSTSNSGNSERTQRGVFTSEAACVHCYFSVLSSPF